jgi:hypothetical protein
VLALPVLIELAALLFALAFILAGKQFVDALLWIVKKVTRAVPFSGFLIGAVTELALQKLSHELGKAADNVGGSVAASWHFLATIVDRTAWTTFHLGVALSRMYAYITVGYPLHILWATAKRAEAIALRGVHAIPKVGGVTKIVYQTITAPARSALAPAVHWLTRGLRFRLTKLEKALAAIAITVGGAVVAGPVKIGYTWKQLRAHLARLKRLEKLLTIPGAIALTTMALTHMGLGWLKCDSLRRLGKGIGCTGFAALEELLAPAVEAVTILELCNYALAAQRLARVVVPQMGVLLLTADALCLGGGASLPSARDAQIISTKISLPSAVD